MRSRQGISLVELLVVMSFVSVILTMSAGLMHRMMFAQSKARTLADVERISLRLAHVFRHDVHQATAATALSDQSDDAFVRLQLPNDQSIEYRQDDGIIRRVLTSGDRTIARDEFVFPPGIKLVVNKDGTRLLVLSVSSRAEEASSPDAMHESSEYAVPVSVHVVAALNRATPPTTRGAP